MQLSVEQQIAVETNDSKVVVVAAAGSGKALENGSLVYTIDGKKKIENLTVGEKIFGEDGNLHTVLGVFPQGKKKKFIVKFTDRTEIACCDEHLWTYQTEGQRSKKSSNWNTATLREIIDNVPLMVYRDSNSGKVKNINKRRNIFIPMTKPVNFPKQNLPLKPYTLGCLLGDGYLAGAGRMSTFTNKDIDVVKKLSEELRELGISLNRKDDINYAINQNTKLGSLGPFNAILRELSLEGTNSSNKFIPDIYKYSSVEDRVELLKGLIDTDGYCDGGSYDYVSKSKQLVLDIKEVCESLGLTAVYSEKTAICTNSKDGAKDCGIAYRLRIKTSKEIKKLHFSQKREEQWKPSKVYSHRAIEEIIETDDYVEMTCISVDNPSKLFLTNNFVVTHNTRVLTERVRYLLETGVKPSTIFAITYTNMAAQEMQERLGDCSKEIFIGTIHSLANQILLSNGISTAQEISEDDFDAFFELIHSNDVTMPFVDHVLVDEFQDVTENEYNFIFKDLVPQNYFIVGDSRQAIYSFKGSNFEFFNDLVEDFRTTVYCLSDDYRNTKEVGRFGSSFIAGMSEVICTPVKYMRSEIGTVRKADYSPADLLSYIRTFDNYGDWFILTRTNDEREDVLGLLQKNNIPCDTFRKSEKTYEELKECMNSNTVKVLTIHSSKGLEAKNVIVIGARRNTSEERRICYVAATRAKDNLIWYNKYKYNGDRYKAKNVKCNMIQF